MSEPVNKKPNNNYIIYLLLALVASVSIVGYLGYSAYQALPTKKPLSQEHLIYAGLWNTEGGMQVQIFEDGSGNFKLADSSVTGGVTVIEGDVLSINFLWFGKDFKITQPPHDGKMVLDGITYQKSSAAELIK